MYRNRSMRWSKERSHESHNIHLLSPLTYFVVSSIVKAVDNVKYVDETITLVNKRVSILVVILVTAYLLTNWSLKLNKQTCYFRHVQSKSQISNNQHKSRKKRLQHRKRRPSPITKRRGHLSLKDLSFITDIRNCPVL